MERLIHKGRQCIGGTGMGSDASINIIIPLISALFGGVVVALVNHFLSKDVRKASLDKMRAETEKTIAEAEITKRKLQEVTTDVQNVRSEVSDTQGKINTLVKYSLAYYLFDHLSLNWEGAPDTIRKALGRIA
jgi:hypothetical protein